MYLFFNLSHRFLIINIVYKCINITGIPPYPVLVSKTELLSPKSIYCRISSKKGISPLIIVIPNSEIPKNAIIHLKLFSFFYNSNKRIIYIINDLCIPVAITIHIIYLKKFFLF